MKSNLDWVILKISQVCNLNCSYCYVYNRGDDSWKNRPKFISLDIVDILADRINEHCHNNDLNHFTIEFHGGEPLTIGIDRFSEIVNLLKSKCSSIDLSMVIQTNGLLLNEEWIQLFTNNNIGIGISLDGPPKINDINRVDHKGKGSTDKLLTIIKSLKNNPNVKDKFDPGFCCVINPSLINGSELVRWFAQNKITSYDFLLPDGNIKNFPQNWVGTEPYKDFLISAFDEWFNMGKEAPSIRMFELMMMGFLGVKVTLDSLGGDLSKLCVVESDGGISVNDVTRICGGDFSNDKLNIKTNPLEDKNIYFQISKLQDLSDTCKECKYLSSCGGGYLPHRFDGNSFKNPSMYCDALYSLSEHIYNNMKNVIPIRYHLN